MNHQYGIANHQSMAYSPDNQWEYAITILTFICVVSSEKVYNVLSVYPGNLQ